jgi:hypothetical protein
MLGLVGVGGPGARAEQIIIHTGLLRTTDGTVCSFAVNRQPL